MAGATVRPALASAAQESVPSGPRGSGPRVEPVRAEKDLREPRLPRSRASCGHVDLAGQRGFRVPELVGNRLNVRSGRSRSIDCSSERVPVVKASELVRSQRGRWPLWLGRNSGDVAARVVATRRTGKVRTHPPERALRVVWSATARGQVPKATACKLRVTGEGPRGLRLLSGRAFGKRSHGLALDPLRPDHPKKGVNGGYADVGLVKPLVKLPRLDSNQQPFG